MKNKIEQIQNYHKLLTQKILYMEGYITIQKSKEQLLRQQIEQMKKKHQKQKLQTLFDNQTCLSFHKSDVKEFKNSFGNYQNYLKCAKYLYKKQGIYNIFSMFLYENQNIQVQAQYGKKDQLEKKESIDENSLKKKQNYLSIDLQTCISFPDFIRVQVKKLNPRDNHQYLLLFGNQKKVCHSFYLNTYEEDRKNILLIIVDINTNNQQRIIDQVYLPIPLNYFLQKRFTYEANIQSQFYQSLSKTLNKIRVQIKDITDLKGFYFLKQMLIFKQKTWQWFNMKGKQEIIFIELQGLQMISQPNTDPVFSIAFTVGMKKVNPLMRQIIQFISLMII